MSLSLALTRTMVRLTDRAGALSDDRGDVPAWVMITVMTAGIVGVLWTAAQTSLKDLLDSAFKSASSSH